jgi:hypothetical protein
MPFAPPVTTTACPANSVNVTMRRMVEGHQEKASEGMSLGAVGAHHGFLQASCLPSRSDPGK